MTVNPRDVSIVVPTRNEGAFLAFTVRWILENSGGGPREIIVVDDGSTDGSVAALSRETAGDDRVRIVAGECAGPARARNLGAREADGHYVVFLDAHCHVPAGWLEGLTAPLADPGVALVGCSFADFRTPGVGIGTGCTWGGPALDMVWLPKLADRPYPVPLLPGGCQALRLDDFLSFGLYDDGMSHIGSEGEEQSLRCWLLGYRVLVEPRVLVHHQFRDRPPYDVRAGELIFNRLRIAALHFSNQRIERVVAALKNLPHFDAQILQLLASDTMARRRDWTEARQRDDDWFFSTFRVPG